MPLEQKEAYSSHSFVITLFFLFYVNQCHTRTVTMAEDAGNPCGNPPVIRHYIGIYIHFLVTHGRCSYYSLMGVGAMPLRVAPLQFSSCNIRFNQRLAKFLSSLIRGFADFPNRCRWIPVEVAGLIFMRGLKASSPSSCLSGTCFIDCKC